MCDEYNDFKASRFHYRYVSDSHGDLEDDILSEGLRVHSWKLARVDSNVSVSGCLPGCSYK